MSKVWLLSLSACLVLVMFLMSSVAALPVDEEIRELDEDKVKTTSLLANLFYNMLQSKGDTEITSHVSHDYDSSYDSSKRNKNTKWTGTAGGGETVVEPIALRSDSLGNYNRLGTNEWKRQIPICLWKVCPAAPWLIDRRR